MKEKRISHHEQIYGDADRMNHGNEGAIKMPEPNKLSMAGTEVCRATERNLVKKRLETEIFGAFKTSFKNSSIRGVFKMKHKESKETSLQDSGLREQYKKGIGIPITAIVVLGLAVIVFVAIGYFFISTGGSQISKVDAERIYQTKCQLYCDSTDVRKNVAIGSQLDKTDPQFIAACEAKGIQWKDSTGATNPLLCLEACPCNVKLTQAQVDATYRCVAANCRTPQQASEFNACVAACGG